MCFMHTTRATAQLNYTFTATNFVLFSRNPIGHNIYVQILEVNKSNNCTIYLNNLFKLFTHLKSRCTTPKSRH